MTSTLLKKQLTIVTYSTFSPLMFLMNYSA